MSAVPVLVRRRISRSFLGAGIVSAILCCGASARTPQVDVSRIDDADAALVKAIALLQAQPVDAVTGKAYRDAVKDLDRAEADIQTARDEIAAARAVLVGHD